MDRVHAVKHHLELAVEAVQEAHQIRRVVEVVAGNVAADVRTELFEQRVAHVADRSDMQLRHPAARGVERGGLGEKRTHVAVDFACGQLPPGQRLAEDRVDVADRRAGVNRIFQAVVAGAAAVLFEMLMGKRHRFEHVVETGDFHAEPGFDLFDIVAPAGREDFHRLVRPPGRTDQHPAELAVDLLMIFERVDQVVGGAHHFDVQRAGQQRPRAEGVGGELRVDLVPDFLSGLPGEQLGDAEVVPEIEMDPLVDRVAGQFGKHRGEREEFRPGIGRTGDQLLAHAAFAEHFPYVVVGGGEELPGVGIVAVVGDLFDVRVVVRVDDRQVFDRRENTQPGFVRDQITGIHESHDISPFVEI
ncbi:hypothetical protein SDC9_135041 [bioreactor metagenome]|uniref:Uncharacterized protein n=1 Tax=bioreactor metagenome TaxID=1076179 RepID=A0A645DEN5_9ZZZZ